MSQPTIQQLEKQVQTFNAEYKVGDKVKVKKCSWDTETFEDEIKHEATILSGHTAITWLSGKGAYDLTFVTGKI